MRNFRLLLGVVVVWTMWYLFYPALSLQAGEFWLFIVAAWVLTTPLIIQPLVRDMLASRVPQEQREHWAAKDKLETNSWHVSLVLAVGVVGIALLLLFVSTSPVLHAARYHAMVGDMTPAAEGAIEKALPELSIERAPLVTEEAARKAAQAKLGGDDPALGSVVEVGQMRKSFVDGRPTWVGFLQHRSLFKWWKTGSTPGYVLVDATDASRIRIVRELDGKPLRLRYLTSAFFGDDLHRHVYAHGTRTEIIAPAMEQIDDEGRPYAVVPVLNPTIGFKGFEVVSVFTVDVQTGEIVRYDGDSAPAWVDVMVPERVVYRRIEDWGEYANGKWFNPSDLGKLQTSTFELDLVQDVQGRSFYVSGLTSLGADTSLTGLVLVDARTGKPQRFSIAGVVEETAVSIVEQIFREKGYRASNPTPLLVEGTPAYVMALLDDAGVAKAYAMLAIQNREVVGTAETVEGAFRAFKTRLNRSRTAADIATLPERTVKVAKVARIGEAFREGTTVFYLVLEGSPEVVFSANLDVSEELSITQPGDTVSVEYQAGEGLVLELRSFDNQGFGPAKTE